jgi:hypothetical protein
MIGITPETVKRLLTMELVQIKSKNRQDMIHHVSGRLITIIQPHLFRNHLEGSMAALTGNPSKLGPITGSRQTGLYRTGEILFIMGRLWAFGVFAWQHNREEFLLQILK